MRKPALFWAGQHAHLYDRRLPTTCSARRTGFAGSSPMPHIVAHGSGDAWACAYCHLPNGQGRPENAPLAGLPAAYIVEQVRAFRSGERVSGRPETAKWMPAEARNVNDADLKLAAEYFSSLHYKPWTRVIESA